METMASSGQIARSRTTAGLQLEGKNSVLFWLSLALIDKLRRPALRRLVLAVAAIVVLFARFVRGRRRASTLPDPEDQKQAIIAASPARARVAHGTEALVPGVAAPSLLTWADLVRTESRVPSGAWETLGMVASSCAACIFIGRQGQLIGMMEQAQIRKDRSGFLLRFLQYPLCCAASAVFVALAQYLKRRLALDWRRAATKRLHDMYFSNMGYYKVLYDGARDAITDAEARMCADVQEAANARATVLHSWASSVTMSLVFSIQIRRTVGSWKVAMLSPTVIFLLVPLVMSVPALMGDSLDWVQTWLASASGAYQGALTRLQHHYERVRVLRGERYELEALNCKLKDHLYWSDLADDATSAQECCAGFLFSPSAAMGLGGGICLLFPALLGCRDAIADGRVDPSSPASPWLARPDAAQDMAVYSQSFLYSMFALASWAEVLKAMMVAKSADGAMQRVLALAEKLMLQQSEGAAQELATLEECSDISFRAVSIQTPCGNRLLEKLTFELRPGQSLLIAGHNGAGKSSIMRCLGGLWPIPSGKILRPGGALSSETDASLHQQVFFLPQRPICVIGSLSDQLTYPVRVSGGLPSQDLRRWLRYVDVEYLVDAYSGASSRDWSSCLSAGEQQALGIARLLYHRPRFAILDECTSAVAKGLEQRLFKFAQALGMAVISIAHRPALEELHGRMLRLTGTMHTDGRGWKLQDLPQRQRLESATLPFCGTAEEAHERLARVLEEAPEQRRGPPEAEHVGCQALELSVRRRWPTTLGRLAALFSLGEPGAWHGLGLQVALSLCLRAAVHWELWKALAGAVRGCMCGDLRSAAGEVLAYAVLQPLLALLDHGFRRASRKLCRKATQSIGLELHRRVLEGGALLRISRPLEGKGQAASGKPELLTEERWQAIPDPVQRVGLLQPAFAELLQVWEYLAPQVAMSLYVLPTLVRGNGLMVLAALPAALAISSLAWALAPDWAAASRRLSILDAQFQSLHRRLRRIAEPVAFNGGGPAERSLIEASFDSMHDFARQALVKESIHDWLMCMLTNIDFLPQLVTRFLNYDFAFRNNPDPIGGISPQTACVTILYGRVIDFARNSLLAMAPARKTWQAVDGQITQILELLEALRMAERQGRPPHDGCRAETAEEAVQSICVEGLDLTVPGGMGRLASGLEFQLRSGEPMLVTGPSGSGKSQLACALRECLEDGSGRQLLAACPQIVYFPEGSLGDQVCYPGSCRVDEGGQVLEEEKMLAALRAAGLAHILGREREGWHTIRNWEEVLSGGEQQRLQLARIFYQRPTFALLDDCTSMVASDAEEGLYRAMFKKFGITPVTFAQRSFLRAMYIQELTLGAGGWALKAVEGDDDSSSASNS